MVRDRGGCWASPPPFISFFVVFVLFFTSIDGTVVVAGKTGADYFAMMDSADAGGEARSYLALSTFERLSSRSFEISAIFEKTSSILLSTGASYLGVKEELWTIILARLAPKSASVNGFSFTGSSRPGSFARSTLSPTDFSKSDAALSPPPKIPWLKG